MKKIRLVVFGASGRMGRALLGIAAADDRFDLVAGVSGRNVSPIEGAICPLFSINELDQLPDFDIAIDFSQPEAFDAFLHFCRVRKAGLVSGTTGLNESQKEAMGHAANDIPVLWASNLENLIGQIYLSL